MRSAAEWFNEYGQSHRNPTNKLIHWICVPLIFFSVVGLLGALPHGGLDRFVPTDLQPFVHWGTVLVLAGSIFYLTMSFSIFVGMLLISALILYLLGIMELGFGQSPWIGLLVIFALAWVGQFIGHKIEGAKPSFFKDLLFLLVGPAWLLGFIYRKLHIPI